MAKISIDGFKEIIEYLEDALFEAGGKTYVKGSDFIIDNNERKYLSALEKYGALTRAGTINELKNNEIKLPLTKIIGSGGTAVIYEVFPDKIEELKGELYSSEAIESIARC